MMSSSCGRGGLLLVALFFGETRADAVWAQAGSPANQGQQGASRTRNYPEPVEGDYVIRDFTFRNGETLPELWMHYQTIGRPQRDATGRVRNAVLLLHGTNGNGDQFLAHSWANELYGPGQPLDASKYFLIQVDNVGHGKSSKPSDGLRAKFPQYGYHDMIEAQHRLLKEGLGVDHLRLVIGTSMGGMHAWLWGSTYPDEMDALLPFVSLPTQVSGRNRIWRRIVIDVIQNSPDYNDGNYEQQPQGLRTAAQVMFLMGDTSLRRARQALTLAESDQLLDEGVANMLRNPRFDANDVLYAVAASRDYDPAPGLAAIKAPLVAINFADDLSNPPELGALEAGIRRVPHGRAVVIPASDETVGHGSFAFARLWKEHLATLIAETERE